MSEASRRPARVLLLLLLLTLIGVVAESFRSIRGPFFSGQNQDPSYSYLIGSLRLITGGKTTFYHHPGVPTQGIGAMVLAAVHTVAGESDDLRRDVLSRPETYLRTLQLTNLALVLAILAVLSVYAWKRSGFTVALFLLLTPFYCAQSLVELSQVGPEVTLVFAAAALSLAIWHVVTTVPSDERLIAVTLGLLVAFAITTRISAVTFALVPALLLTTWRGRIFFVIGTVAGGSLAILPLIPYWSRFTDWVFGLGRRTGHWGSAPRSLFEADLYIDGFVAIFSRHHALFAVLVLAISVWLWHRSRYEAGQRSVYHRALGAVLIGQVVLVLLVTKNPASRYLVPATALVGLDLALIWMLLKDTPWWATRRQRIAIAALFVILPILLELPQHRSERDRLRRGVAGQQVIEEEIAQLSPGCTVAEFFRASSLPFALHFGHRIWPMVFSDDLAALYPQEVFYDFRQRRFESFSGPLSIADMSMHHPCVVLRGFLLPHLAPLAVRQTYVETLYAVPSLAMVVAAEETGSD